MTTSERSDPLAALGTDVTDHRLTRPDGRTVAWSESGVATGRPILRIPGTPGSRLSLRADRSAWIERGLRVITTERPGFGASTRLEGRAFVEHSDDTAAILDVLGIEALPVYGASGASPHILDFAARHPERVQAATILVGAAPLDAAEAAGMIDLNALGYRLFHEGKFDEILALTNEVREAVLADPLGSFRDMMASAPDADRAILEDPGVATGFRHRRHRSAAAGSGRLVRRGPRRRRTVGDRLGCDHHGCDLVARRRRQQCAVVGREAGRRPAAKRSAPRLARCRPPDPVPPRTGDP